MTDNRWTLHRGDCREIMARMDADSVDSIVTDPPYGLSFMGRGWDRGVPGEEFWRQALRVAKPGAHLLAFGGTRTFHRLACAIEDAGWEIRDCVMWVYSTGFPKSHNIGKAIDKAAGVPPDRITENAGGSLGGLGKAGWHSTPRHLHYDSPKTDAARRWEGWGTALKPAWEPIIVARKPFRGTVAANVLEHGTGAINVDGCRVGTSKRVPGTLSNPQKQPTSWSKPPSRPDDSGQNPNIGRWPANLIHDGSQMVLELFPVTGPSSKKPRNNRRSRFFSLNAYVVYGHEDDGGSAARFFYCAKASKRDRNEGLEAFPEATPGERTGREDGSAGITAYAGGRGPSRNIHPTVKPTDLMRYLCRLVTQPGGVVLDPFAGSGSTGKAALLEGFRFVGCELADEYADIAEARMRWADGDGESA